MKRMRVSAAAALLALAAGVVAWHAVGAASSPQPAHALAGLPAQVLGLNVARENVDKTLAQVTEQQYTSSIELYSFRDPTKLLQATLQISTFRPGTPAASAGFQLTIVQNMGGSVPELLRVGVTTVYVTTIKGLVLAVWFNKGHLFVMSIRNTFHQPKALLRVALEVSS